MSIAASLSTLRGVRDAIRDAIVSRGGVLPVGSPMGSYAQAITDLPSGSGGDTEIPFRSRLTVPGDTDPVHLTSLTATKVNEYAFYGDKLLTSVSLPVATSISTYAFRNCSALTTADFPVATSISTYAFYGCTSLTTADFPVATSIGSNTFYGCTSLTSLTLSNTTTIATLSSTSAFQNTPIANGTGHIYVPDHLVDGYKTATNWNTYANQILPISQKP